MVREAGTVPCSWPNDRSRDLRRGWWVVSGGWWGREWGGVDGGGIAEGGGKGRVQWGQDCRAHSAPCTFMEV
jgi:hypothetical protein